MKVIGQILYYHGELQLKLTTLVASAHFETLMMLNDNQKQEYFEESEKDRKKAINSSHLLFQDGYTNL